MPSMDGIELASKISSDKRFEKLLLVAITTRFSGSDRERGLEAGFNRYLEKLNAEKLILELDELLSVRTSKSDTGKELKLANSY
jgi:CheY-like chemotaxis protein